MIQPGAVEGLTATVNGALAAAENNALSVTGGVRVAGELPIELGQLGLEREATLFAVSDAAVRTDGRFAARSAVLSREVRRGGRRAHWGG